MRLKSFTTFVNECIDESKERKIEENWKHWLLAGLGLFLSLFSFGENITGKGTGSSKDYNVAVHHAKSGAISDITKQLGANATIINGGGEFKVTKQIMDKDGNYIIEGEYTIDKDKIKTSKKNYEVMDGKQALLFMGDLEGMGYTGGDWKSFIDKWSDNYNFKISKMTTEEADQVGEFSVKVSKTMKDGNTVWCVVTPCQ